MSNTAATINAQTPGPCRAAQTRNAPVVLAGDQPSEDQTLTNGEELLIASCYGMANARLLAASYTAFDKAGRELGIDAAELASRLDLAALMRAAYAVVMDIEVGSKQINALATPLLPFVEALSRAD